MPPTPKECPVKECEYKTPPGLPNYDTVYKDIEMHLQYFHMDIRPLRQAFHSLHGKEVRECQRKEGVQRLQEVDPYSCEIVLICSVNFSDLLSLKLDFSNGNV